MGLGRGYLDNPVDEAKPPTRDEVLDAYHVLMRAGLKRNVRATLDAVYEAGHEAGVRLGRDIEQKHLAEAKYAVQAAQLAGKR